MKRFLFFLICFTCVVQAFGQSNTNYNTQNNGLINSNSTEEKNEEEKKLEVPVPQTMPELKEESEHYKVQKKTVPSVSSGKYNQATSAEKSNTMFSSSRKTASTQLTSRSPSTLQQEEMNQAINFYKINAPESFEYHYFTYTAGNYNIELYPHLLKAQELKPANSDVITQVAAYEIITGDSAQAEANLTKLVEMGKLEQEVLAYDKDVLNSVPAGSVLLTHGFDDSYGTFYLNSVMNIGTEVKIISLDFMQSTAYRDSLKKDGFKIPASTTVDVNFLNEFCKQNEEKKLFLSMTFPKPYLSPMVDKLSIHGLVFAYSTKQAGILEENELIWSELLKNGFIYKARTERGKQLSSNYLPLLFYLRENYQTKGLGDKLDEIDEAIDRIGVQSNKMSKVNSMRGLK